MVKLSVIYNSYKRSGIFWTSLQLKKQSTQCIKLYWNINNSLLAILQRLVRYYMNLRMKFMGAICWSWTKSTFGQTNRANVLACIKKAVSNLWRLITFDETWYIHSVICLRTNKTQCEVLQWENQFRKRQRFNGLDNNFFSCDLKR